MLMSFLQQSVANGEKGVSAATIYSLHQSLGKLYGEKAAKTGTLLQHHLGGGSADASNDRSEVCG